MPNARSSKTKRRQGACIPPCGGICAKSGRSPRGALRRRMPCMRKGTRPLACAASRRRKTFCLCSACPEWRLMKKNCSPACARKPKRKRRNKSKAAAFGKLRGRGAQQKSVGCACAGKRTARRAGDTIPRPSRGFCPLFFAPPQCGGARRFYVCRSVQVFRMPAAVRAEPVCAGAAIGAEIGAAVAAYAHFCRVKGPSAAAALHFHPLSPRIKQFARFARFYTEKAGAEKIFCFFLKIDIFFDFSFFAPQRAV